MDNLKEQSPLTSQKIRIQADFLNSIDTGISQNELLRTKRVKKPKHIEDLGFEDRGAKGKKTVKKTKGNVAIQQPKGSKKIEICQIIFQKFKDNELYQKFSLFHRVEKGLKGNLYLDHRQLATEIRKIFNQYFTNCAHDPSTYSDTFQYSNFFEDTYRDYENKTFNKESKNILDLKKKMNKLRKEIRERNVNSNQNGLKNKLRIDINDYNVYSEKEKKISKKYKMSLVNNIRSLNSDQIKGIINIIHDNLNVDEKTMEFDINNLPADKLKELDKYVKKCLKMKKTKIGNSYDRSGTENIKEKEIVNNKNGMSGINLNININNNFMVGNFHTQNSYVNNTHTSNLGGACGGAGEAPGLNLKKRNSILSDSDSLSSDEESDDSNSLSSIN